MAARRAFGQIRKLPSGRYQARYQVPGSDALVNAPATFRTKVEADKWLSAQRVAIDERRLNPEAVVTLFEDYAEAWLKGRDLRTSTRVLYRRHLDRHLLPRWGKVALSDITPADVREWHAELAPGSTTGRAHSYALLRTILGTAVADDLLDANPCRVRGAGQTKRQKKITPASLAELGVIVEATEPRFRLMVLLAAWCALRLGEVTALTREDIDVERGAVKVRRAVNWATGQPIVDDPKTEAGIRDVAIPPHLLPVVEAHLKDHVAEDPGALLFPAVPKGTDHLNPDRWRAAFRRSVAAAGREDLTFHGLRHTGAVLAAATGATVAELMARLGHTTPNMAMKYQHAAQDRDQVIAQALSTLAGHSKAP